MTPSHSRGCAHPQSSHSGFLRPARNRRFLSVWLVVSRPATSSSSRGMTGMNGSFRPLLHPAPRKCDVEVRGIEAKPRDLFLEVREASGREPNGAHHLSIGQRRRHRRSQLVIAPASFITHRSRMARRSDTRSKDDVRYSDIMSEPGSATRDRIEVSSHTC